MKNLLLTVFLFLFINPVAQSHEKSLKTRADTLAHGTYEGPKRHAWPFPLLSIGHNMQSYQKYGMSAYWHDGLDIRSQEGQPIYASAGGKVVNVENYQPGNALYWEVAILDDEGFVWKYHHVNKQTIPAEIQKAFKAGGHVAAGTYIGDVVKWPISTFGEVYNHLHLLVVGKDGKYINPLLMLDPLADTAAPVIHRIGLAKNHRPLEENQVKGPHAVFVEATDLILHGKFTVPPHKISYKLDGQNEVTVWEFVHLPSGTNDTDYINDFFMEGTCGNYQCRKFYFNLNFTTSRPRDVFNLSKGQHSVEVIVEDAAQNRSSKVYEWTVL